jgi:hypothetical protein
MSKVEPSMQQNAVTFLKLKQTRHGDAVTEVKPKPIYINLDDDKNLSTNLPPRVRVAPAVESKTVAELA